MWGESSSNCENNCQCSELITDRFQINSGNGAAKRKQEESFTQNFKIKMNPHSLNFNKSPSPVATPKRRILGELQNINISSPFLKVSPTIERLKNSPHIDRNSVSPLTSRSVKRSTTKISRIFEERSNFKMNKENETMITETFVKLEMEEETRDYTFASMETTKVSDWSMTKLDFTDTIPQNSEKISETTKDVYVPEKDQDLEQEQDFEALHDLEEEFENENFDECNKYEIISTDSPNIISRGRSSTSRKVNSRNFIFGAPIADSEQSTSFNKPTTATRMLNFEDETFEFTSPAAKRSSNTNVSVKKSLKFNETPTKNMLRHERSDSSIGSMSSFSSPASSRNRLFTLESTTSMESGFISELDEPFLELEESSSSPKVANFSELLSGTIKDNIITDKEFSKRPIQRSTSFHPEMSRARMSLFSIMENTTAKRSQKRTERCEDEELANKRRKPDQLERVQRPVLQRAFSENNASIMSALTRSLDTDEDLVGDFSRVCVLPLTGGPHSDLKYISCDTLAALLRGEFEHTVSKYQVIDCRYPYEYEGGHVRGSKNLYTTQLVSRLVEESSIEAIDSTNESKPEVHPDIPLRVLTRERT
ncbi:hypothetical protein ACJJTC_003520 [Scirpophaga incertulas]